MVISYIHSICQCNKLTFYEGQHPHVSWGEFHTAFCAHHLSVGLLHRKLKEFLDLEQGNHSLFDYMRQFITLAQYGSYHISTDEMKANLCRAGLTIHLQERLGSIHQPVIQQVGECHRGP
jgi:hypothetical protein